MNSVIMISMKKTIVIFGISSLVGSNLAEALKHKYRIIGTYYNTKVQIDGVLCLPCDVLSRETVQMILYKFQPEFTLYCVGLSSIEDCSENMKLADALNTAGVFNVTNFSERYKSKFIYISSSYIFSGEDVLFKEGDTPLPNTDYGTTMSSAEFYIQKSCLNYLILRCCSLYGRGLNPNVRSWMELIEERLSSNQTLPCDNNVITGFLDIHFLAKVLDQCLEEDVTNRLFQVSSSDFGTRYDFALKYSRIFGFGESLVVKSPWSFPINQLAARDSVVLDGKYRFMMDTSNIHLHLGIKFPTIEEAINSTFERLGGSDQKNGQSKGSTGITYI